MWRRFRQPLPLIGVGLIVIALAGYLLVARQARAESDVVAAARNLPAGTVLRRDDLELIRLGAGPALLAKLVPAADESALVGRRLAAPATAGLPLPEASVAGAGGGPAAFTLAVGELHALGGDLLPGDRVSVLATFTSPNGTASARVVARGLVVLAVGQPPAGLDPASATIPVTVALPDPTVASRARARKQRRQDRPAPRRRRHRRADPDRDRSGAGCGSERTARSRAGAQPARSSRRSSRSCSATTQRSPSTASRRRARRARPHHPRQSTAPRRCSSPPTCPG